MNDQHRRGVGREPDDPNVEPRWIKLAADLRAEPAPGTLAPDGATLVSALLDDDGSFGLGVQSDEPVSASGADSGAVAR